jgi:hypothetical protein
MGHLGDRGWAMGIYCHVAGSAEVKAQRLNTDDTEVTDCGFGVFLYVDPLRMQGLAVAQ